MELTRNPVVNIGAGFTIRNSVEELSIPIPTCLNLLSLFHILKISEVLFPQSALFANSHDSVLGERLPSTYHLFHRLPRSTRRRDVEHHLPLLTLPIFRHDLLDPRPRCPSLMDALLDQLDLVVWNVFQNCFVFVHFAFAVAHQYDAPRQMFHHLFSHLHLLVGEEVSTETHHVVGHFFELEIDQMLPSYELVLILISFVCVDRWDRLVWVCVCFIVV